MCSVLMHGSWSLPISIPTTRLRQPPEGVEAINDRVSGVRDFSNDVVAIFDSIDSVGVDIPLLGRLSAMGRAWRGFAGGLDEVETPRALWTTS